MSKKGGTAEYLGLENGNEPEYLTAENGDAKDVESLDDFLATFTPKSETLIMKGRALHFQGGSPKARDALLAKHRKDDGTGNKTVEEAMWMTDAIALTWVTKPGGSRILDSAEKANRFHASADADDERAMYEVAKRMLGLKADDEKETARKNLNGAGTTASSVTSQSASSTLYPENSGLS